MSVFNDFLDIPFNKFGEHTSQLFVLLTDFFCAADQNHFNHNIVTALDVITAISMLFIV